MPSPEFNLPVTSEDEARQKWCPLSGTTPGSSHRGKGYCVGSKCMSWLEAKEQPGHGVCGAVFSPHMTLRNLNAE